MLYIFHILLFMCTPSLMVFPTLIYVRKLWVVLTTAVTVYIKCNKKNECLYVYYWKTHIEIMQFCYQRDNLEIRCPQN